MRSLLWFVVFLCTPCRADDYRPVFQVFRDFGGGLNNNSPAINLAPNETPFAKNVVIDDPVGTVSTRKGFSQCGTLPSGNTPTHIYEFAKSDGSRRLLVTDNQNYYSTPDCVAFTTIKTGLGSTARPSFATVRDKTWIATRSTHVFTWDGSTAVLLDGGANTPSPAPERCAYVKFWRERVWCARSDSNPSGVAFSALTDGNGNAVDPSTGTLSWPAANLIQVDQNGGSPIYGIAVYRDKLYVFKNNGIWRVDFENEFNVVVSKTMSQVGSRFHESIVEQDSLLWFVGPDGFYAFDGEISKRISDKFIRTFESLNQPLVNNQFKVWTTNADFDGSGTTAVQSDTAAVSGSILVGATTYAQSNYDDAAKQAYASGESFISHGHRWTSYVSSVKIDSNGKLSYNAGSGTFRISTAINEPNFTNQQGRSYQATFNHNCRDLQTDSILWFMASSTSTRANGYSLWLSNNGIFRIYRWDSGASTSILNSDAQWPDLNTNPAVKVVISSVNVISIYLNGVFVSSTTDTTYTTSKGVMWEIGQTAGSCDTTTLDDFKEMIFWSTGSWTSDIYNAVTVSSWSTLDLTAVTNGVTPTYQVRVGTNSGGVQSTAFTTIAPGTIINGTTSQIFVQTKVNTTSTMANYLELKDITVNWSQGGVNTQTIFGRSWKNRVWWSASTGTATTNNAMLVKSRNSADSIVPYDLQIGAMTNYNDNFYAVASTHSGIYRLDYGTNDNGAAIDAIWDSRDETFGAPGFSKSLLQIGLDYEKGPSALLVGWSRDGGVTFSTMAYNLSGAGRSYKTLLVNGGNSTAFRFRIRDNTLDDSFKIYGLEPMGLAYPIPER